VSANRTHNEPLTPIEEHHPTKNHLAMPTASYGNGKQKTNLEVQTKTENGIRSASPNMVNGIGLSLSQPDPKKPERVIWVRPSEKKNTVLVNTIVDSYKKSKILRLFFLKEALTKERNNMIWFCKKHKKYYISYFQKINQKVTGPSLKYIFLN